MKAVSEDQQSIVFFRRMAEISGREGTVLKAPEINETIRKFECGEVQTLLVNSHLITGWCCRPVNPGSVKISFLGEGWEYDEMEQARARVREIAAKL